MLTTSNRARSNRMSMQEMFWRIHYNLGTEGWGDNNERPKDEDYDSLPFEVKEAMKNFGSDESPRDFIQHAFGDKKKQVKPIEQVVVDDDKIYEEKIRLIQALASSGLEINPENVFETVADASVRLRLHELHKSPKPKKGLLLTGGTGCGKTTLIKKAFKETRARFITAHEVIQEFQIYGIQSLMDDKRMYSQSDTILDDLGAELSAKRYGESFDLSMWIEWRYECFEKYSSLTHFTTNLASRQAIEDCYNQRIFSRICEMCDFVVYDHKDRRRC